MNYYLSSVWLLCIEVTRLIDAKNATCVCIFRCTSLNYYMKGLILLGSIQQNPFLAQASVPDGHNRTQDPFLISANQDNTSRYPSQMKRVSRFQVSVVGSGESK